jgi:hypothetical protein
MFLGHDRRKWQSEENGSQCNVKITLYVLIARKATIEKGSSGNWSMSNLFENIKEYQK